MANHFSLHIPVVIPPRPDPRPFCPICDLPISLESANTDERGRAIHEDCYVIKLALMRVTAP